MNKYLLKIALIIPTLSINWCDLIFASDGLFFNIGMNDFEMYIFN